MELAILAKYAVLIGAPIIVFLIGWVTLKKPQYAFGMLIFWCILSVIITKENLSPHYYWVENSSKLAIIVNLILPFLLLVAVAIHKFKPCVLTKTLVAAVCVLPFIVIGVRRIMIKYGDFTQVFNHYDEFFRYIPILIIMSYGAMRLFLETKEIELWKKISFVVIAVMLVVLLCDTYKRDVKVTLLNVKSDAMVLLGRNVEQITEVVDEPAVELLEDSEPEIQVFDVNVAEVEAGTWNLTMYAGMTNNQSMFYTLEDSEGHFIVIDGGWDEDVELVKTVIELHGNKVDLWIISHPHFDHVRAFNDIYGTEDGPDVSEIWISDFDYDKYQSEAAEWDWFFDYENFYNLTKDDSRVRPVYTGDVLDLYGLTVEVFHDYTAKVGGDAANDGSLMLKFTGKEDSWLFCADVGISQSDIIIGKFGGKLQSTYLTMGHHGNGGLSDDFYRLVNPKLAFFDAPEWLMFPAEDTTYDTDENAALMESMGAEVVWWDEPYHSVVLR